MFLLAAALGTALVVGVAVTLIFSVWAAILPALLVGIGTYVFLLVRMNKAVQVAMGTVMQAIQKRDVETAILGLQAIKQRYGNWAPFLGSQIDGQIGAIHFMKGEFDKARPYLERAFFRSWDAKLMLAVLRSGALDKKRKAPLDLKAADEVLEKAARYSEKQGLLWSTWAWLHAQAGDNSRAIALLTQGKGKLGESDPHLSANLLALQNDKKMKMKGYGDAWYSLHLEEHPMVLQARRSGNVRFARR